MSKLYRPPTPKEASHGIGMVPLTLREVVAWVNEQFQKAVEDKT